MIAFGIILSSIRWTCPNQFDLFLTMIVQIASFVYIILLIISVLNSFQSQSSIGFSPEILLYYLFVTSIRSPRLCPNNNIL